VGGTGSLADPWDGSTQAKFDNVMSTKVGPNTRVHLGPGIFQTRGYSDEVSGGWQIQAGMKIIGSGMDVTTLQLVDAQTSSTAARLFAIGHALTTGSPAQPNLVDAAEICDLTVDSNLPAQSGTQVACGAVRLMGNHVKVSRVKAINWGTKTSSKPCFVIAVITGVVIGDQTAGFTVAEVCDTGIEGCIVVEPDTSANVGPATALHAGGKEESLPTDRQEAYGEGPYIRNCFVDCGDPSATPVHRGLSMGWCRGGTVEGNQVQNTRYGGPCQDKASTRDVVVRGNVFRNVRRGPWWDLGQTSSLTGLTRLDGEGAALTALATKSNHGLQVGERVKIEGTGPPPGFFGVHVVTAVPAPNQFRYVTGENNSGTYYTTSMRKVYGVGRLVVEGNVIELATGSAGEVAIHLADTEDDPVATEQTPDFRHGDMVIRHNKIRYVDGWLDPAWSGTGIKLAGAKNVIVSENSVECAAANPIKDFRCGAATYFHNETPSGALIQGCDGVTNMKFSELEEDALLLTRIK
jgi:hypothetical protein